MPATEANSDGPGTTENENQVASQMAVVGIAAINVKGNYPFLCRVCDVFVELAKDYQTDERSDRWVVHVAYRRTSRPEHQPGIEQLHVNKVSGDIVCRLALSHPRSIRSRPQINGKKSWWRLPLLIFRGNRLLTVTTLSLALNLAFGVLGTLDAFGYLQGGEKIDPNSNIARFAHDEEGRLPSPKNGILAIVPPYVVNSDYRLKVTDLTVAELNPSPPANWHTVEGYDVSIKDLKGRDINHFNGRITIEARYVETTVNDEGGSGCTVLMLHHNEGANSWAPAKNQVDSGSGKVTAEMGSLSQIALVLNPETCVTAQVSAQAMPTAAPTAESPTKTPEPTDTPSPTSEPVASTPTPEPKPTVAPAPPSTVPPPCKRIEIQDSYIVEYAIVPPHVFIGTAIVGGIAASEGDQVKARIDDFLAGSANVVGGSYRIIVRQLKGQSFEGKNVFFYIEGMGTEQSGIWSIGGADTLNLTVRQECQQQP